MGIDGPEVGFSCWAWDYDNDGWLDIFATCYAAHAGGRRQGSAGQCRTRSTRTSSTATWRARASRTCAEKSASIGCYAHDGQQLRRLRQRRLPRLLPGHRRPEHRDARPQPHVQERRRPDVRRHHRIVGDRPPAEGPRRGLRRLGPQRHGGHLHPDGRVPYPATSITTSCSRTPARKTLAEREAGRQEDQPGGHRGANQGGDGRRRAAGRSTATSPPAAASGPTRSSRRSASERRNVSICWRSTGRPATRRRPSATSPQTRPSRSPSLPRPSVGASIVPFRCRNDARSSRVIYNRGTSSFP